MSRRQLTASVLLLVALLTAAAPAAAVEIRFQSERIYVYEEEARRGFHTMVLHGLAVAQPEGPAVTLDELRLEVVAGGRVTQSHVLGAEELAAAGQRMAALEAQGALALYEFALQLGSYVPDLKMAGGATIAPGTALVVRAVPFLVRGVPDALRATAVGATAEGEAVTVTAELPVVDHDSPNEYRFPLAGPWLVAVGPNLSGHHRWIAGTEFSYDIVRLGAGGLSYEGEGTGLDDYFAYGEPVLAAADGEVVAVETGVAEDTKRLRRPGESWEAFEERTVAEQAELMAGKPIAAAGNYVTLRHAGGEYSHYAHLAGGSVRVKPGQAVRRGEVLGRLGHTGNSTEPHLHFQVMNGPDALASDSLPVRFHDLEIYEIGTAPRHLQTGWIVTAPPPEAPAGEGDDAVD